MNRQTDTPGLTNGEQEHSHAQAESDASIDEVELGIGKDFPELDERGEPVVMSRTKPRGLLPIPREVEQIIAKEEARLLNDHGIVPTPEARQRMVDSFTLQYYYDGIDIAYRATARGVEVVAVGLDEVGELIRTIPQEHRADLVFGQG